MNLLSFQSNPTVTDQRYNSWTEARLPGCSETFSTVQMVLVEFHGRAFAVLGAPLPGRLGTEHGDAQI